MILKISKGLCANAFYATTARRKAKNFSCVSKFFHCYLLSQYFIITHSNGASLAACKCLAGKMVTLGSPNIFDDCIKFISAKVSEREQSEINETSTIIIRCVFTFPFFSRIIFHTLQNSFSFDVRWECVENNLLNPEFCFVFVCSQLE